MHVTNMNYILLYIDTNTHTRMIHLCTRTTMITMQKKKNDKITEEHTEKPQEHTYTHSKFQCSNKRYL